jgi:hypothetical protein
MLYTDLYSHKPQTIHQDGVRRLYSILAYMSKMDFVSIMDKPRILATYYATRNDLESMTGSDLPVHR